MLHLNLKCVCSDDCTHVGYTYSIFLMVVTSDIKFTVQGHHNHCNCNKTSSSVQFSSYTDDPEFHKFFVS